MKHSGLRLLFVAAACLAATHFAEAAETPTSGLPEELAVKREAVFEFARKPQVAQDGKDNQVLYIEDKAAHNQSKTFRRIAQ